MPKHDITHLEEDQGSARSIQSVGDDSDLIEMLKILHPRLETQRSSVGRLDCGVASEQARNVLTLRKALLAAVASSRERTASA